MKNFLAVFIRFLSMFQGCLLISAAAYRDNLEKPLAVIFIGVAAVLFTIASDTDLFKDEQYHD